VTQGRFRCVSGQPLWRLGVGGWAGASCNKRGQTSITIDAAVAWARQPAGVKLIWWWRRQRSRLGARQGLGMK